MRPTLTGLILLALVGLLPAQTSSDTARLEFDVASVKPADPDSQRTFIGMQAGGRFTASASLRALIGFAYQMRSYQISGGPRWLDTANYSVEGRPQEGISMPPGPEGIRVLIPMVQSLLADRFKLVVHRETKEGQIYNLVLAKDGAKLKESENKPGRFRGVGNGGPGQLTGTSAPLGVLAVVLSERIGRTVIDKTGLTGTYDFELKWSPDPGQSAAGLPAGISNQASDPNGPSIFTAIQEQLGLKLESARAPVDVLVVDQAEKPSEN
jgi:bla regulator protein BlaR1